jgi:hypothetical protein
MYMHRITREVSLESCNLKFKSSKNYCDVRPLNPLRYRAIALRAVLPFLSAEPYKAYYYSTVVIGLYRIFPSISMIPRQILLS